MIRSSGVLGLTTALSQANLLHNCTYVIPNLKNVVQSCLNLRKAPVSGSKYGQNYSKTPVTCTETPFSVIYYLFRQIELFFVSPGSSNLS